MTSSQNYRVSSTTSSFGFSIRLLAQCIVYRRKDFTASALIYKLCGFQISGPLRWGVHGHREFLYDRAFGRRDFPAGGGTALELI